MRGLRIRVMELQAANQPRMDRRLGAWSGCRPHGPSPSCGQGQGGRPGKPPRGIWNYRLDKVQKYLSLTRHVYSAHIWRGQPTWFQALPPADQKHGGPDPWSWPPLSQRQDNRRQVAMYLAKLKKAACRWWRTPTGLFKQRNRRPGPLPMCSRSRGEPDAGAVPKALQP